MSEVVDVPQITGVDKNTPEERPLLPTHPVRKCFTCEEKNTLIQVSNKNCYWKCETCEEIYYSCIYCDDGLDWSDNDKGFLCCMCDQHCCGCFPCMDKFRFETDEYGIEVTCGDCKDKLKKRRKRRV